MSRNEIIKNKRITRFNNSITKKRNHLSNDVYSFTKIVSGYFDLSPYIEERTLYILKICFNDYSNLLNSCLSENIVLGTLLYVSEESHLSNLDINEFIRSLYKKENIKKNTIQIYFIASELKNIFIDTELCVHESDMIKRRFYN